MKNNKGMLITIYGPNNIGKSTQTSLLAQNLIERGFSVLKIKYPIYSLEPTGPKLNKILRVGNADNLTEFQIQKIFAQNRVDFDNTLINIIKAGIIVIAEDYVGTGIAWGLTNGARLNDLEKINKDLYSSDLSILMDGERFIQAKENNHKNEDSGALTWQKSREHHLMLAKRYKWIVINANQSIEAVHNDILSHIKIG